MNTRDRLTEIVFQAFGLDGRRERDHETAREAVDALMAEVKADDRYNGWANRETWAVALHINNDQGWQESVHETVRNTVEGIQQDPPVWLAPEDLTDVFYANRVGDAIRENVEDVLESNYGEGESYTAATVAIIQDIGSLWRVDWTELGAAFLSDLDES